jgi:preprotein translocase subunit SecG
MYELILGIIIFLALLLVLIILAQNAKGGGLSSQFGGSGASNIIGVKKTGDLLEKLTWAFAIGIMVLTLSASFLLPTSNQAPRNEILDEAGQQGSPGIVPPLPLPSDQDEPSAPADSAE